MTEQEMIIDALGVTSDFNVAAEARQRIDFLSTYLQASGLNAYVLGISGGVDSLAAALLAQRAVEELRAAGYEAKSLAVRLPYGAQADESDAQWAVETYGQTKSAASTSNGCVANFLARAFGHEMASHSRRSLDVQRPSFR
ncbi:MAG: hypothetical protein ACTHJY_05075, partial [Rhizobiaceae bacterium]